MKALPQGLRERLNITAAIAAEIAEPPNMLPSRVVESVLAEGVTGYAERLQQEMLGTIDFARAELIWASKARLYYRPILAMPFKERVIYRALVNDVAIPPSNGENKLGTHAEFARAVLVAGTKWVATADVAAYFEHIDHEGLADEIVTQTAKGDTARALRYLLIEAVGRTFGLPQNLGSSRSLSEFYIAPVERQLLQVGLNVARYIDDFRIGTASAPEAFSGLEQLQYRLYERGLALNEAKSRVTNRKAYEEGLDVVDKAVRQALAALHIDPAWLGPYPPASEQPIPRQDLEGPTRALFQEAVRQARAERRRTPLNRAVARNLLITSLRLLAVVEATDALPELTRLMLMDPSLAQAVGSYLRHLAHSADPPEIVKAVENVATSLPTSIPPWQQAWIVDGLLNYRLPLSSLCISWVRKLWDGSAPWLLRARAGLVLAVHKAIDPAEVSARFGSAGTVARPDLVAAVALLASGDQPTKSVQAVLDSDPVFFAIYQYARAHSENLDWL